MNNPQRLRDDPAFNELTSGALHDEPLALGPYDLPGLRDAIVRGQAPPPPAGPRWTTLVGISGLTAALVTLALWAFLPVAPGISPLRPTPAPPVIRVGEVRTPARVAVLEFTDEAATVDEAPRLEVVDEPVRPGPTETILEHQPVDVPEERPVAGTPTQPTPRGLREELADYNRALDAADAQRWAEARERFDAYLDVWPAGRLRNEARLGLLSALVKSNRPSDAESLAAELLGDPAMAQRRQEIRLLRAEALVELNRCDEALTALTDQRRSARVNAVRATCRRNRR